MKTKVITAHYYSISVLVNLVLFSVGTSTNKAVDHGIVDMLHKSSSLINEDSTKLHTKGLSGEEVGRELYPMGSSLPDCSHACGVCSPCKRVMVSFRCTSESCPVVYRCLCNGKYYHVPSSN